MTGKGIGGHERANEGATNVWLTPPALLNALGPFDLDPCAASNRPWDTASKHYTIEEDGLKHAWQGFVWCNPPYGPHLKTWLSRLAEHNHGIALVFARTETEAFFETVWPKASSILFLKGRLHFHRPDGVRTKVNAGAPSVLIGYGAMADSRLAANQSLGRFVSLRNSLN